MPRPARTPYDIDTITEVALEVFRDRGYDGASMEHLAKAAGVSKAAFYHHVGGKEELLDRGLAKALDALAAVLEEPGATEGTPIERIGFILRRIVELEHTLLPHVTVLLRARGHSEAERKALTRRRAFDRHMAALVAEAQGAGEVRSDIDAKLAARLVVGMATWIVEWYQPKSAAGAAVVADAVVAVALDGIRAR